VIFLDSDDYIDVDSCERFLQYAENGCDIIIGEAVVEGGKCNSQHISNPNMMTGEQYLLEAYRGGKAPMAACFNIYKREFLNCIDRATLLVKEGDKKPIIISITDDNMELKINSTVGSMNENIDIEKSGKDLMIGFNPKFLIDALKVIDDEEIDDDVIGL
jgi:hypothetical protein